MNRFFLVVEHKGGGRQRLPLEKRVTVIGRLESSDVVLGDFNVSRTHARIHLGDEGVEIEDLGSKNSTFVNGEAVTRRTVAEGDRITIGENALWLERRDSGAEVTLSLRAAGWDIADRLNPEGVALLSPETYLHRGRQELASDLGRLVQIYRLSQRINERIGDYSQLIEEVGLATQGLLEADTCALVYLPDRGGAREVVVFPAGPKGCSEKELVPAGVLEQLEKETKSFLIRVKPDGDEGGEDSRGTISAMCAPLLSHGERTGFFYLVRRQGAAEFVRWDLEYLTAIANLAGVALANARSYRHALEENRQYEDIVRSEIRFVGGSPAIAEVTRIVRKVADSQASILISGESGTGKELVARAIHAFSQRRMYRFVPINCAAIPENLLESELFGVEKGAFTDAREKAGRIELAHQGTLFLDEISDMPPFLQAKLLRVLQQREFERLGGLETRSVDVRILSATNRDIAREVQGGRFREDLLYRIQVLRIDLPPLRERREDIPLLVEHFLSRFAEKNGTPVKKVARDAMEMLVKHDWPGNVRELENALESALVLSSDWILWPADFPLEVQEGSRAQRTTSYPTLQDLERDHILKTLRLCNGNKKKTAQQLGITRQTLDNKLGRYAQKS